MKRSKNFVKIVALCVLAAMVLSGCGGAAEPTETTKESVNIMQKSDPSQDDTLNILMIGNSFCYYYPDELYGLAEAAGIKIRVCNVYYSGCTLEKHWTWWKNNEANYEFFTYDENGRQKVEGCNLEYCLQQQNWDVITLQGASKDIRAVSAEQALENNRTYYTDLWNYIKEQFPQSKYYWHNTWAYQVGYDRDGYAVSTAEEQTEYADKMKEYSIAICQEMDIGRIPTGEAWRIVRAGGYDNLCARMAKNNGEGDYYHDGDVGGGQYLNACVWFEVLTGQSCIGNTFRPSYTLSEEMITTLQQAAHQAVADMNK